ncbi:hypothetical protein E5676_scaffold37G00260 [Cucumis melo var. makuwa]|uniref:Ulp1-like peptidase n=1 Tax=Cucumis melo var. makuwa TaxID=1194695 RepID=A0A5D3BG97_CUCMM|nr:hypothetical protein E5676_scaffold37G00260 [Cucumis melo var. makuwa]
MADESDMHPMTKKKNHTSNDNKQQSHSKSYKRLKKNIKEVHKDVSALTSIVCKMDDTINKQSLELSEMKQMLERLLEVTLGFFGFTANLVGVNYPLLGWIRLDANLNKNFSYISGNGMARGRPASGKKGA